MKILTLRIKKFVSDNLGILVVTFVALLCATFLFCGTRSENGSITLDGTDAKIEDYTEDFIKDSQEKLKSTIIYSEEKVPAKIVTEKGEETIDVPTLDAVEGTKIPDEEANVSDIDGRGAYHDTSTYLKYYNSVGLGDCINNAFGAQCFALANDFWQNYAGRALSSCGTGAAKGTLNCWQKNAGNEFVMVWNSKDLQPGDWVVFKSGEWGHIGMAMGYYNKGYISLFGQNQGGGYCPKGGAGTNVVNLNLATFGGAFRPKTYVKPEPKPEPKPTPDKKEDTCKTISVKKGDTLGAIMKRCTGKVVWGTAMNDYAKKWTSTKVKPGQTVYNGWISARGVGLYAGDVIKYSE